jgi:hypothetical protein
LGAFPRHVQPPIVGTTKRFGSNDVGVSWIERQRLEPRTLTMNLGLLDSDASHSFSLSNGFLAPVDLG